MADIKVSMRRELLDTIFEGAKRLYPKESILLLRGRKTKNIILITDLLVPPLASYGRGFAHIPLHMRPMDFSVVGTVHSHPSGNFMPSSTDLNHFFGRVLMIVAFPFLSEKNVAIYNHSGERLILDVTDA
ncbi:Mov34/MPN/PAD-1 family protein [Candidatus Bathyarchaeota archaeon]|nr:Mov34/MPN/PAD-1 family protein [Candidatus Bathyarchaeota archaeon]